MPKVPRRNYTRRRRRRRRPYSRRRRYARVRRPILSGFPSRKMVKLRYVDTGLVLDPAGGSIAQDIYRANSILDPYQPVGGHQPLGSDQWSQIYNQYTVVGAKFTMRYANLSITNLTPGRFGVLLSSDTIGTASFTTINNLLESKLVGQNTRVCGTQPYGIGKPPQVVKMFSAKKFFGKVNVIDGSANSGETGDGIVTGTNPGNEAYFIPWCSAQASGQNPGAMNFDIIIDYIVIFHDPKNLDGS